MSFKRTLDTMSLSDAFDALADPLRGVNDDEAAQRKAAGVLGRWCDEKAPEFARLNDWMHDAPQRIVDAYQNGEDPTAEDSARLAMLIEMAREAARRQQG